MRDLTIKEAYAEAKKRWGKTARVELRPAPTVETFAAIEKDVEQRAAKHPDWTAEKARDFKEKQIAFWREDAEKRAVVGLIGMGIFFEVKASARTFREAFAEIDARAERDRQEIAQRHAFEAGWKDTPHAKCECSHRIRVHRKDYVYPSPVGSCTSPGCPCRMFAREKVDEAVQARRLAALEKARAAKAAKKTNSQLLAVGA